MSYYQYMQDRACGAGQAGMNQKKPGRIMLVSCPGSCIDNPKAPEKGHRFKTAAFSFHSGMDRNAANLSSLSRFCCCSGCCSVNCSENSSGSCSWSYSESCSGNCSESCSWSCSLSCSGNRSGNCSWSCSGCYSADSCCCCFLSCFPCRCCSYY